MSLACWPPLPEARKAGVVAVLTADQGPERRYREFARVLRGGSRLGRGHPRGRLRAGARPAAARGLGRRRRCARRPAGALSGTPARSPPCDPTCPGATSSSARHRARSSRSSGATPDGRAPWCRRGRRSPPAAPWCGRCPPMTRRARRRGNCGAHPAPGVGDRPLAVRIGPVLVQVARRGYLPFLACQTCREPARCACGGPLELASERGIPFCALVRRAVGSVGLPVLRRPSAAGGRASESSAPPRRSAVPSPESRCARATVVG